MDKQKLVGVRGLVYIDESGQCREPRISGTNETCVVASVVIPDTASDREVLANLVANLRNRLVGGASSTGKIEGAMLDAECYGLIAKEIRSRWVFGHKSLDVSSGDANQYQVMFHRMLDLFDQNRKKLQPHKQLDLTIDFLKEQYRRATTEHSIYLAALFALYRDIGRWFRKNERFPYLRVWLDDKLKRVDAEFHRFFGRFAVYAEYPEIFAEKLGVMMGVDASHEFDCHVASDQEEGGLVIADAIAFAAGKVARNDDPTGFYKGVLDSMSTKGGSS